ncbi:ABC transporter substrate-binding protein [Spiractinospora alimapuensis]|uniref:ABC transporter substrate-binding protein n=1 Tax=Spiractinospora alimapuensis TaxID=2820884 RepID=UPI001F3777D5|nr:ABC transporter substrate-binding protein [Spiractinospora alimapuensis]QVQ54503.1 ABC transporter substrate-binding protein [Spiractinospora alimapuensis]
MRVRVPPVLAAATAVVVGLTGCTGTDTTLATNDDGLTVVDVATIPVAEAAPLYMGIEMGYFADEGLDVRPEVSSGGAALLPAVLKSDMHIGWANPVTLLLASQQGIDLSVVASGALSGDPDAPLPPPEEPTFDLLSVAPDSDITEAADLDGAVIGVASLNSIVDLTLKASIDAHGGDSDTVEIVELSSAEQAVALAQGRIDAAKTAEPFATAMVEEGNIPVLRPYTDTVPGLQNAMFFTSGAFQEDNPEVVDAFRRAMNRSLETAQEDPDEARAMIPTYTDITPEQAESINLPYWSPDINWDSVDELADMMVEYDMAHTRPDPDLIDPGVDR